MGTYANPNAKPSDFKVGDGVVYTQVWEGAPQGEDGVVTKVTNYLVFVRYGRNGSQQATNPRDLVKKR